MSKTPGKDFEDRIRNRLEKNKCQVEKLRDSHSALFNGPEDAGPVTTSSARFSAKNPYDFRVDRRVTDTTFHIYALECKTVARGPFALATLKDHQLDGLSKFWGTAGVIFESRNISRCWFIPVASILSWIHRDAKKSMSLVDLNDHAVELPGDSTTREKRAYYNMTPLLSGELPKSAQGGLFS